jgi:hypothetical protein
MSSKKSLFQAACHSAPCLHTMDARCRGDRNGQGQDLSFHTVQVIFIDNSSGFASKTVFGAGELPFPG